jgi:hypothetical protein
MRNWRVYERGLVSRGDVTLWLSPDARAAWGLPPSSRPGGQQRFSDLAIETALTLRLVFHLPFRQTEGFVRSLLTVMCAGLDAPDHTTLSRRSQWLDPATHDLPGTGPLHLIVDSTGLSVVGEGEWAAAKHGGRGTRGWKKLHLGVDRSGVIVAHALTESTVDDATMGIDLIGAVAGDIASVTADAAYDTVSFYEAASARHAQVVVPPIRTGRVSRHGPRSSVRDRTINDVETLGRREWQKASGYHRQARVENAFFRYKSISGDGLRARSGGGREVEASLACRVLNRMTALGSRVVCAHSVTSRGLGEVPLQIEPCTNAPYDGHRQVITSNFCYRTLGVHDRAVRNVHSGRCKRELSHAARKNLRFGLAPNAVAGLIRTSLFT